MGTKYRNTHIQREREREFSARSRDHESQIIGEKTECMDTNAVRLVD